MELLVYLQLPAKQTRKLESDSVSKQPTALELLLPTVWRDFQVALLPRSKLAVVS